MVKKKKQKIIVEKLRPALTTVYRVETSGGYTRRFASLSDAKAKAKELAAKGKKVFIFKESGLYAVYMKR